MAYGHPLRWGACGVLDPIQDARCMLANSMWREVRHMRPLSKEENMKRTFHAEHSFDYDGTVTIVYYPYEWDEAGQEKRYLGSQVTQTLSDTHENMWHAWKMWCLYQYMNEPITITRRRNMAVGRALGETGGGYKAWFKPSRATMYQRTQP